MASPEPTNKTYKFIRVGRINTRYRAAGSEGPPLLLLHGLAGYIEIWERNFPALSEHFRVVAPDLVGNGRSDKPKGLYDFSFFAMFIKDLLDCLRIERASVIGHSLGGGAALRFAIMFPERIDRLILIGSAGLGRKVSLFLRLCTVPLIGEILSRPSRKGAALGLKMSVHDPEKISDQLLDTSNAMAKMPGLQSSFLSTVRALGNLRGLRDDALEPILSHLKEITAPTLALWGRQDRVLPADHIKVLEAYIPNVRIHIFDSCGHMPQYEYAEEFNRMVLDFLKH